MKKINLVMVLVLIVLGILIYYQNDLTKDRITSSTIKTPTGSVVQEIEKEEVEPVIKEEIEEVIEEKFPETFLTDVKCIGGKEIIFTLNNILREKKIETLKLTFYAAGYTIRNPICDKQELNPKESTDCRLNIRFKLNKIIKFTIAYPAKSQSVNIDCEI